MSTRRFELSYGISSLTVGYKVLDLDEAELIALTVLPNDTSGKEFPAASGDYFVEIPNWSASWRGVIYWYDNSVYIPGAFEEFGPGISSGNSASVPADDQDLVTLAELKTFLNLSSTTYDALLATLITAASYALLRYCERDSFYLSTYSGTIFNGNGQRYLTLPNTPVTSLTSVITDYNQAIPTTFAGSMFDYESETGEIRFKPNTTFSGRICRYGFQNVRASYSAGYSTVPADLKLCCMMISKFYYQRTTVNSSIKSETIGDYKYENFQPIVAAGVDSDPALDQVRTMLAAGGYYRPHVYLY